MPSRSEISSRSGLGGEATTAVTSKSSSEYSADGKSKSLADSTARSERDTADEPKAVAESPESDSFSAKSKAALAKLKTADASKTNGNKVVTQQLKFAEDLVEESNSEEVTTEPKTKKKKKLAAEAESDSAESKPARNTNGAKPSKPKRIPNTEELVQRAMFSEEELKKWGDEIPVQYPPGWADRPD